MEESLIPGIERTWLTHYWYIEEPGKKKEIGRGIILEEGCHSGGGEGAKHLFIPGLVRLETS